MYRFEWHGSQVECDSVAELHAVLGNGRAKTAAPVATEPAKPRKKKRRSGKGMAASWAAARKLSKEKGIPIGEARSQLAKAKVKAAK